MLFKQQKQQQKYLKKIVIANVLNVLRLAFTRDKLKEIIKSKN